MSDHSHHNFWGFSGWIIAPLSYFLADKAYDAGHFRGFLMNRKIEPVIPSTGIRKIKIPHDETLYKQRDVVERIKNWRRGATRYNNFFVAVCLAPMFLDLSCESEP